MKKTLKEPKENIDFLKGYYQGLYVASLACLYMKEDNSMEFDHQKTRETIQREMKETKMKIECLKMGFPLKRISRKLN